MTQHIPSQGNCKERQGSKHCVCAFVGWTIPKPDGSGHVNTAGAVRPIDIRARVNLALQQDAVVPCGRVHRHIEDSEVTQAYAKVS